VAIHNRFQAVKHSHTALFTGVREGASKPYRSCVDKQGTRAIWVTELKTWPEKTCVAHVIMLAAFQQQQEEKDRSRKRMTCRSAVPCLQIHVVFPLCAQPLVRDVLRDAGHRSPEKTVSLRTWCGRCGGVAHWYAGQGSSVAQNVL
jgi:hypothetical protein